MASDELGLLTQLDAVTLATDPPSKLDHILVTENVADDLRGPRLP
jgi:hypothetical protein